MKRADRLPSSTATTRAGRWWQVLLWLCLAAWWPLPAGAAGGPPTEPQLRLEAGMHTATIKRIATDAAGRYAVTASDDKTARVWDVATGQLLRVLRPPIAEGHEGKLYAVALSPDGSTVAVAGWTGWDWYGKVDVYLFDRTSGRLLRRLQGLPEVINHLAFSPDGRWLAATLCGKNGIRVWDWRSGAEPAADASYGADSYGAHWSRDGRLATTSWDGKIRLYRVRAGNGSPVLERLAEVPAPGGQRPYAIAFRPNGAELAVGYADSTRVDILDSDQLAWRYSPDVKGVENGQLSSVTWSADGRQLLAAGRWEANGLYLIRRWPDAGRGAPVDTPATANTIMDLQPLPDGRVLVAGADPAWGVLNPARSGDAAWQLLGRPPSADLRGSRNDYGYAVSADGRQVQFGYEPVVKAPHRFDLPGRRLMPGKDGALSLPRTTGLAVENWINDTRPTLDGQPLKLNDGEMARSLAITAGASQFVLGTEWYLRRYNARGEQGWAKLAPGVTWGVNIPPSGKVVVAAYGDGTIRWHRLMDGQELLAFFPHADRQRWVLWTPSGYYDASPGGEELIGWHINRGPDEAVDFFPASRFRERFYRPDVIDRVLDTLDEAQAVDQANAERGRRSAAALVLPPVVDLLSQEAEPSTSQTRVVLRVRVRTVADAPVTQLYARVNGQALPAAKRIVVEAADGVRELTVEIPPKDSEVQIFAENRHGTSTPATVRIRWTGTRPDPAAEIQPKLYVLAIGVGQYQHGAIPKLRYPGKDAGDFVQVLKKQHGQLYREVVARVLTDQQASRDEVIDGLEWLQKQVTQHDVGMLFLSGHGANEPSLGYVYLPVNADPDKLKRTVVTMADIRTTLNGIPGKVLAFLDTCHSGNVFGPAQKAGMADLNGVINELSSAENGVVVFSSSTGRQFSLEDPQWNNGAFTKALVEGFEGRAAQTGSPRITFKMLDLYVTERVKVLTKGLQSPVTQAPGGVNDFPLAMIVAGRP